MSVKTVSRSRLTSARTRVGKAATWAGKPRPADWPALPALSNNTFNGLIAVFDALDGNRVALSATVTGGFTVDWGDGTTDTWASGATAEHQYAYSDVDLTSTTLGYKVALVKVTSTTPANAWSAFTLQTRHSSLSVVHDPGWLDFNIQAPSLTDLTIAASTSGTQTVRLGMLWGSTFGALGTLSSLAYAFYNCWSLTRAPSLPSGFNASLANAFQNCTSLTQPPALPAGFNSSLSFTFQNCSALLRGPALPAGFNSTMASAFGNCQSLIEAPALPAGFNSSLANVFDGCRSLTQAPELPAGFNSTMDSAFINCQSLTQAPTLPSGFNGSLASTFQNCQSLTQAPALPAGFNNSLSSTFATCRSLVQAPSIPSGFNNTMASTFVNCSSLTQGPTLPITLISGGDLTSTFSNCVSLKTISGYANLSAANFTSIFNGCVSLESAAFVGTKFAISYLNCNLSGAALNAIYTNLAGLGTKSCTASGDGTTMTYTTSVAHPYIVGQTVTITGMSVAGYNGSNRVITSVPSSTTFTVAGATTGSGTGGTSNGGAAATITVTGNWGTASDDTTIATNKGWTVTG